MVRSVVIEEGPGRPKPVEQHVLLIVVFLPGATGQIGAIISGAIGGLWLCKNL